MRDHSKQGPTLDCRYAHINNINNITDKLEQIVTNIQNTEYNLLTIQFSYLSDILVQNHAHHKSHLTRTLTSKCKHCRNKSSQVCKLYRCRFYAWVGIGTIPIPTSVLHTEVRWAYWTYLIISVRRVCTLQ